MVSFEIEDKFLQKIDYVLKNTSAYKSRSEFFKESARKNLENQLTVEKRFAAFVNETEKLRKISRAKGNKGGLLTPQKREDIVDHLIKKKKVTLT